MSMSVVMSMSKKMSMEMSMKITTIVGSTVPPGSMDIRNPFASNVVIFSMMTNSSDALVSTTNGAINGC